MATNQSEFALHLENKGKKVVVLPGDDLPEWAKITNPYVLGLDPDAEHDDDGAGSGPPPRAGKGSGEDKWRAYAEEQGVDVSEAEGRDDVIAALEEADVPVE
jgi:hypothetical protein